MPNWWHAHPLYDSQASWHSVQPFYHAAQRQATLSAAQRKRRKKVKRGKK